MQRERPQNGVQKTVNECRKLTESDAKNLHQLFRVECDNTTFCQAKIRAQECNNVDVILLYSCLYIFTWYRIVLMSFDPKQVLQISYI